MALPPDTDSSRPDQVRDRRAINGVWMLVAAVLMFVALAFARSLG
ncbi:hypothetical protein [Sphingomonas sp. UNC305MFCol5.2]|nr:hypothetical protein [Sphingomonas sp. UNC305MFCol5.2]